MVNMVRHNPINPREFIQCGNKNMRVWDYEKALEAPERVGLRLPSQAYRHTIRIYICIRTCECIHVCACSCRIMHTLCICLYTAHAHICLARHAHVMAATYIMLVK